MDADTKMARARTRLVLDNPFFGSLALGLNIHRDDSVPTMCTDGRFIKWNGDFVDQHTDKEIIGVVAHEVLHVAFKHMLRRGERDPERWNIACDHAINHILLDGSFELPEGGLFDPQFKGMTAERIYDQLVAEQPEQPTPCPWGEVTDCLGDDGEKLSKSQASQVEATIDQRVMLAAASAKGMGKLPAAIAELVEQMRRSKVDWRDVFNRFIGGDQPDDYTWRRPQKNAWFNQGVYLPSVDKMGAGDVIILGDSSASVTDAEWSHFLGEMNAITDDHKPRSVTVITFDTKVQTVKRYEQGEVIEKVALAGRGGTRITPAFDYVEEHQLPCDNMVVLTDLEISDFPDAPDFPVLWVSTDIGSDKAPWGEVAILKMGD